MNSREKPEKFEEKNGVEKLRTFIESVSSELQKEGIPVNSDSRINIDSFKEIYPTEEIEKDKQFVEEKEKGWYGDLSEKEKEEEILKSDGEKLELLKNSIFNKNLGSEFIITRSSRYDDIKNGVDNVLLERKTGNVICALDEVGDISGVEYERKKDKILERNRDNHGAKIKYGLSLKEESGEMKLKLGKVDNIPIFYIALSKSMISKALTNFNPSPEQSDFEKKLFDYFISTLDSQVKGLELVPSRLSPELKKRLDTFNQFLKDFRE